MNPNDLHMVRVDRSKATGEVVLINTTASVSEVKEMFLEGQIYVHHLDSTGLPKPKENDGESPF